MSNCKWVSNNDAHTQVDGVVIRTGLSNQEEDEHSNGGGRGQSKRSQDASGRYDLLFGVVTSEALWRFSAADIQNGFEGERRDKILRTYVRNAYTYHLSEIFYTVSVRTLGRGRLRAVLCVYYRLIRAV